VAVGATARKARGLLWAIAKAGLRLLFTLWVVMSLSFALMMLLPSDPARIAAGPQARPADVAAIRKEMGADLPARTRYANFWRGLLRRRVSNETSCMTAGPLALDLGRSYQLRKPVTCLLSERLPRTGMMAISTSSLLLFSAPTFAIGLTLQYVFAHRLGLLPIDGYGDTEVEHAMAFVLPALTLGLSGSAYYIRVSREKLRTELTMQYARTARAKGASNARTLIVHALRNILSPLVTLAALDLGYLASGAVVTESIFRFPGIGTLSVNALLDRDVPVLNGVVMCTSAAVVLASVLAEVATSLLDPRISRRS
jgi:peptide/nickel transport system permease protein